MLNQRREIAQEIAGRLAAAENAVDVALALAGELAVSLPVGRAKANVAAEVGQEAMAAMAETLTKLVTARAALIETHHRLADARDLIGLRAVSFGGLAPKPSAEAHPLLSAVS